MKSFFEKEDFIFNTRVYQKIVYNNKEDILFKIEDIAEKATLIMRDYEEKLSFFKENSVKLPQIYHKVTCFTDLELNLDKLALIGYQQL